MFKDRVALVTGAGGGLGRATALLFARQGARVACADISEDTCEETVSLIRQSGGEAISFVADLSQHDICAEMVKQTVRQLGGLHHSFNNAGIRGQAADPWDEKGIRQVLDINLDGVIWAMKHQIAHMTESGGGTIVNNSSIAGLSGGVASLDYTAAKYGVVGITKSAAFRYGAKGVRINAVCPGVIDTPMTRGDEHNAPLAAESIKRLSPILHALGEPDDIAEAVIWLSSRLSKFVYGVALAVDGGFSIN